MIEVRVNGRRVARVQETRPSAYTKSGIPLYRGPGGKLVTVPERNPRVVRIPSSPGSPCLAHEAELYQNVEKIFARKGPRSADPRGRYYHDFRYAAACGRPDGSVVLRGRGGRRLWRLFAAEE